MEYSIYLWIVLLIILIRIFIIKSQQIKIFWKNFGKLFIILNEVNYENILKNNWNFKKFIDDLKITCSFYVFFIFEMSKYFDENMY